MNETGRGKLLSYVAIVALVLAVTVMLYAGGLVR